MGLPVTYHNRILTVMKFDSSEGFFLSPTDMPSQSTIQTS
jgi:hypothetical protein